MTTLLTIIITICGLIYFIVAFIYFLTASNPLEKFFSWVEREIKKITNK